MPGLSTATRTRLRTYQAPAPLSLRMNSGGYVQVISSPRPIRRLARSTGTGGNACWGPPEKCRRSDGSSGLRSSRALGVVEWFAAAARPHDHKCSCPACDRRCRGQIGRWVDRPARCTGPAMPPPRHPSAYPNLRRVVAAGLLHEPRADRRAVDHSPRLVSASATPRGCPRWGRVGSQGARAEHR